MAHYLDNYGSMSRWRARNGARMESSNSPKAWLHQQKIIKEFGNMLPLTSEEGRVLCKRLGIQKLDEDILTDKVYRMHPEELETTWRFCENEQWNKAICYIIKRNTRFTLDGGEKDPSFF